jgi:hypothetical protein
MAVKLDQLEESVCYQLTRFSFSFNSRRVLSLRQEAVVLSETERGCCLLQSTGGRCDEMVIANASARMATMQAV